MDRLSAAEARRVALHAQDFGRARRSGEVTRQALARTAGRLHLHQVDSVNVLVRAHYLPAFSRLGPYDRAHLDAAAWGARRERRLFEYWAHECSLLPLALHPLLRWRMARAERGLGTYGRLKAYAGELRPAATAVLERVRAEGPKAASDLESMRGPGGWWGWGEAKNALEWLFWAGQLTTATRRGTFERVYDLPERVLPAAVLALPTPSEAEAHRALMELAARALGVATFGDLRDYFRLGPEDARAALRDLVGAGRVREVRVEGWRAPAYLHAAAAPPRRRATGSALLAPFDPLVWARDRAERLFGFRYRIEIYVPAHKRLHGYYVLPFLHDDRLVARVDLKADRAGGRLLARAVHWEAGAPDEARDALRAELGAMAGWLGLAEVAGPAWDGDRKLR